MGSISLGMQMKQSLFDDEPFTVDDLKLQCKKIYLKYEDIVFSPLPQLLCQNCGFFGRTFRCPPFAMPYYKTREYLKQFNKFLLIISESDPEQLKERYRHEIEDLKVNKYKAEFYMGTQAQMINLGRSTKDLKKVLRFVRPRYEKSVGYGSAGCHKCRPCKKHLHRPCEHPLDSFSSPEGSGVDLYKTLRNKGFEIESPPVWRYVAICMVCWKE